MSYRKRSTGQYQRGRFRVKTVKHIYDGYVGMNPLAAEALHIKNYPRRTYEVLESESGKNDILRHEVYEYGLLEKVKRERGKVTKSDYLEAHRQTVAAGYP